MTSLVLASRSPRRADILTRLGVQFVVDAANLDESPLAGESPGDYVVRLATAKCLSVAARHTGDVVTIGADTTVDVDGEIFGTPPDLDAARHMLQRLAGRQHLVHTAVCMSHGGVHVAAIDSATVTMTPIAPAALERYLTTGESLDKAGAYAVQGEAAAFVEHVAGHLTTVIGLPVLIIEQLLRPFGLLPSHPQP